MNDAAGPAPEERRRPWGAVAIVVLTLLVVVADLKGLRDLREARSTAAGLEDRIAAAEGRLEELERRRSELVDADAALEELAREDLGMVKPGDVVIVLSAAEEDEARPVAAEPAASEGPGGR